LNTALPSAATVVKYYIQEHPYLSVTVKDRHIEKPCFEGVSSINLEDHMSKIYDDRTSDGGTATL